MIIGTITNWSEVQGQINDAPNVLAGTISSAELMGGQIVGMRGLKGDKGDAGTTDYNELLNRPQIEGETLTGDKSFADLHLNALTNAEIEELLGGL